MALVLEYTFLLFLLSVERRRRRNSSNEIGKIALQSFAISYMGTVGPQGWGLVGLKIDFQKHFLAFRDENFFYYISQRFSKGQTWIVTWQFWYLMQFFHWKFPSRLKRFPKGHKWLVQIHPFSQFYVELILTPKGAHLNPLTAQGCQLPNTCAHINSLTTYFRGIETQKIMKYLFKNTWKCNFSLRFYLKP